MKLREAAHLSKSLARNPMRAFTVGGMVESNENLSSVTSIGNSGIALLAIKTAVSSSRKAKEERLIEFVRNYGQLYDFSRKTLRCVSRNEIVNRDRISIRRNFEIRRRNFIVSDRLA